MPLVLHDDRLPEARDLLDNLVTKSLHKYTNLLIEPEGTLVLQVDDTVLYSIPLKTIGSSTSPIAFKYASLLKEITVDDEDETDEESEEEVDEVEASEDRSVYYGSDPMLIGSMDTMYRLFRYAENNYQIVASDEDLRANEEFETLLNLKSDQGLKYFKLNGEKPNEIFLIPMFAGFIKLSKPDKIGIRVFDTRDGFLIVEFNIFKKKINRSISLYCRIIKL